LNDSAEVSVFANLIQKPLAEELKNHLSDKDVQTIVSTSGLYTTWSVFVCSFCTDGDRNEHWHQYAKRAGYALGFDPQRLRSIAKPQGFSLAPVIYGEEAALNIATAVVQDRRSTWQSFKSPLTVENTKKLSNYVCRLILSFAPFFKSSSFEREVEWRLVKVDLHENTEKMKFRANKIFGLMGYYEFHFKVDDRGKLRRTGSVPPNLIPRLMVGPGNETSGWLRSVNPYALLKQNGFETLVSQTKSSLRITD
jgi:hypothetical protein